MKDVTDLISDSVYIDSNYKKNTGKALSENNYKKGVKNMPIKILLLMSIVLIAVGTFLVLFTGKTICNPKEVILFDTDKVFVDSHDYVFIAKIDKKLFTKRYSGGEGDDIPYTFYQISIIDFLKGNGDIKAQLCFYGGTDILKNLILNKSNDILPIKNEYYLFFANKRSANSNNNRIGPDNFIIAQNIQKIQLNGYNKEKKYTDQNSDINLIIRRYLNVINKDIYGDEKINIPIYANDSELVDAFDYIFIAQINNTIPVDTSTFGSSVATVFYYSRILYYLKGSDDWHGRLCFYGIDYWDDDAAALHMPSLNNYYLIFANKKDINSENSRVNENDYMILADYQIVLLEGYDEELYYLNQNDDIIFILDKYINLIS
ncbi:MAG: hypothetical protein M0R05_02050 [Bacilli bacterium]|nr:hypothetical protein [Bacilli bacterium]MDD4076643.1 hypothetical protein [Bacilli bacterium]MDD4388332.1 hypothetical protein [Bacilli bacterium]